MLKEVLNADVLSLSDAEIVQVLSDIDNFLYRAVEAISKDKKCAIGDICLSRLSEENFDQQNRKHFDAFMEVFVIERMAFSAFLFSNYDLVKKHFAQEESKSHLRIFAYALLKCRYRFGDEYFKLLELAVDGMVSESRKMMAMEAARNIVYIDVLRWLNYQLDEGYINEAEDLKPILRKSLKEVSGSVSNMYKMSYNAIGTFAGVSDTQKIIWTVLAALLFTGFCLISNPDWIGTQITFSVVAYVVTVVGIWNNCQFFRRW